MTTKILNWRGECPQLRQPASSSGADAAQTVEAAAAVSSYCVERIHHLIKFNIIKEMVAFCDHFILQWVSLKTNKMDSIEIELIQVKWIHLVQRFHSSPGAALRLD